MGFPDYVAGTFADKSVEQVLSFISPYSKGLTSAKGHHGYAYSWFGEGFRIYYGGPSQVGCFLQISGEGCRAIEEYPGFDDWGNILRSLREDGIKFTRLDLAFDDREGLLDPETIEAKIRSREYTSRYTAWNPDVAYNGDECKKWIIRLGDNKGQSQLVFYNKRLEQLQRGFEDMGHWVRAELRYHDKLAEELASWAIENPKLEGSESFLTNAIVFREPGAGAQKVRWSPSDFWLQFTENCARMQLRVVRPVKTLLQQTRRFVRQYSAVLAMLCMINCEGLLYGTWLRDVLGYGAARMSDAQYKTVEQALGHKVARMPRSLLYSWEE
jgi:DNA relaxase NicK